MCLKSLHIAEDLSVTPRKNGNIADSSVALGRIRSCRSAVAQLNRRLEGIDWGAGDGWEMNQPLENRGALALQAAAGPFGPRLRMERERRRITLDSIAANTKINLGLLRDLERDNVSGWPAGIYRRSFIKAYAKAIGLDPEDIAREFQERFPEQDTFGPPPEDRPSAAPGRVAAPTGFRLTLVQPEAPFSPGCILRAARSRGSAVAWDIGVVLVVATGLFVLLGQFWRPLGIFVLAYYTGSIFLLGNTPGVSLFAAPRPGRPHRDAVWSSWVVAKSALAKAKMRALVDSVRHARVGGAKQVNAEH